ncbi:hypothetical protein HanXRQr2_Chr04g0146921 [Helianthus annuus]|uniref:Uncharacterized protein n=1 Tax=Helianthus annuus TaxID=4232 RepID=A0A9K3J5B8_HELAN|nr:hypothetical protein HanXRQr2_Chr04g0146921 [Helianthus annuus]KAJ0929789.1 hypothetical protein HanPSC8_Chr04g0141661 [Helianthus annuus]
MYLEQTRLNSLYKAGDKRIISTVKESKNSELMQVDVTRVNIYLDLEGSTLAVVAPSVDGLSSSQASIQVTMASPSFSK